MTSTVRLQRPPSKTPGPPHGESGRATAGEKREALLESLRDAGLLGQVRVGVPLPAEPSPYPRRDSADSLPHPRSAPGLDSLLRPLEGSAQGRLIELAGPPSSGRTALAYRLAAGAAARGEWVGWVDPGDALDPRFLRRTGLDLRQLLWVRPQRIEATLRCAELLLKTGFALVVIDLADASDLPDALGPSALGSSALGSSVWARLLRAVRGARATAVLIARERVTGSFATLGLHTERAHALFDRGLLEGLEGFAQVVRNRTGPADAELPFRVLHRP